MAITIFGRGWPLSAVVTDASAIFTINGSGSSSDTTIAITSGGAVSATDFSGTNVKATTVTGTTVIGATVGGTTISATNFSGTTATSGGRTSLTFTGGGSATLSGGAGTISADVFLQVIVGGKTYYMPGYASAGALSAL